ncbi:hypothetical protein [uncultured Oscillibacter sp.]|uniref:hypothetical protein n=1 Tax=uncultured Oscillibacter sp. TaxID=876091 RepID=UPI0025CB974F|nr:hypothetical protein [uncultured Oscillibacter sp.]
MGEKRWQNQYRDTLVCIDSWDDGVCTGRLIHRELPGPVGFRGVMQFLLEMEKLLDDMQFPEPFAKTRSFTQGTPLTGVSAQDTQKGHVATFNLRVLFRQNASWQGSLQWLEGHQEASFRSVLELLLLLNSTVEEAKQGKTD